MSRKGKTTVQRRSATASHRKGKGVEHVENLMEDASQALTNGDYFECEIKAVEAMHRAWDAGDFDMISRITLPLQEARRQRRLAAIEAECLFEFDDEVPAEGSPVQAGVYVIAPPSVGADAHTIAEAAFEQRVPVIAFAREPKTQLGLIPVVVVGATTIRTKVRPPASGTSVEWCLEVLDALTQEALAMVDYGRPPDRQVDTLIDLLDTLPESELIHQKLAEVAQDASQEAARNERVAS